MQKEKILQTSFWDMKGLYILFHQTKGEKSIFNLSNNFVRNSSCVCKYPSSFLICKFKSRASGSLTRQLDAELTMFWKSSKVYSKASGMSSPGWSLSGCLPWTMDSVMYFSSMSAILNKMPYSWMTFSKSLMPHSKGSNFSLATLLPEYPLLTTMPPMSLDVSNSKWFFISYMIRCSEITKSTKIIEQLQDKNLSQRILWLWNQLLDQD